MKQFLVLLCGLFSALLPAVADEGPKTAEPRPETRPYVRWWWLGSAVDREGIDFNLSEFARQGIGGVEITPIYGVQGNEANDLEYLSPAWMEAYRYTVERGRELGIQVDMSNCTGWPFGGPWVTTDQSAEKYILEELTLDGGQRMEQPLRPADKRQREVATLEALQAVSDGGERLDLKPLVQADGTLDWTAPAGSWRLYALYAGRTFQKVKRAAPGGAGYVVNHYNRTAVEHYLRRFDEAFAASGAPWPDTFFNDSFEVYNADWDRTLLAEFERQHGYRLQDFLPEFAAKGADERSARIVSDYRRTLAGMLYRNFTLVWRDWAHGHGCRIRNQAHGSPGNIFDLYAAVDIPECESYGRTEFRIPGLRIDPAAKPSDADPAVLKFASSAAHVSGKRLTSCESLTWLSEHFRTSLACCKPEIDQILASGVNHLYFHGAPYSPRGADFPGWLFYASINMSPTAPFWEDAPAMLGYVERCQSFLQQGAPDNDLLLYIPMEDISHEYHERNLLPFEIHKMDKTMPVLKRTMNRLVRSGFDADYISDRYLAAAAVRGGRIVTEGGTAYRALVLPRCRMIPVETLRRILALVRAGATVLFMETVPDDVGGYGRLEERRKALGKLTAGLPAMDFSAAEGSCYPLGKGRLIAANGEGLTRALERHVCRPERLAAAGCQAVRRADERGRRYFVSLLDGEAIDGYVELATRAEEVILTDPLTGLRGRAAIRPVEGAEATEVRLQLQPGQSILIEARTAADKTAASDQAAEAAETEGTKKTEGTGNIGRAGKTKETGKTELAGTVAPWRYAARRGRPIEGRAWTLSLPQSDPAVDTLIALEGPRSWCGLKHEWDVFCGTGRYTALFRVEDPAAADGWWLDLGDVRESARVRVNGHEAGTAWSLPFGLEVGQWLTAGDNRIEIDVRNLPANRIADMDRRGVRWRIFKDANIAGALTRTLETGSWGVEPSGLNSAVQLIPWTCGGENDRRE